MCRYLGVGAEECNIRATTFTSPLVDGIARYGSSTEVAGGVDVRQGGLRNAVAGPKDGAELVVADEEVGASSQTLAWLEYNGHDGDGGGGSNSDSSSRGTKKLGVADWCGDQYFSSIRSSRVLVRGDLEARLSTAPHGT